MSGGEQNLKMLRMVNPRTKMLVALTVIAIVVTTTFIASAMQNGTRNTAGSSLGTAAMRPAANGSTAVAKWIHKAGSSVDSSPVIADVDGDGGSEVIFEVFKGVDELYCLNNMGGLKWKTGIGSLVYAQHYGSAPVVCDLDGDNHLEILVGSYDGRLYCTNASGGQMWTYQTGGYVAGPVTIIDIDGDSHLEVLFGSYDHSVYCLNSTGGLKWMHQTGDEVNSCPVVTDVDGDRKLDVVIGSTDHCLYCLNSTGQLEWSYQSGGLICASPAIGSFSGHAEPEIVFGSGDMKIYSISLNNGNVVTDWTYGTGGSVYSSPVIKDVDGDGQQEVILGSIDARLYCLNGAGQLKWEYQTGANIMSRASVADIDGDGMLEILIGSYDHSIYCLDATGGLKWSYATGNIVASSAAIADIDGDGKMEVLIGSGDGNIYCLNAVSQASPHSQPPPVQIAEIALTAVIVIFMSALLVVRRRSRVSPQRISSRSISTYITCPYCGAVSSVSDAEYCMNCGASLQTGSTVEATQEIEAVGAANQQTCIVCNLDVKDNEESVSCPYCGCRAHRAHLLEWLHIRKRCPVCQRQLSEEDINQ